MVFSSVLFLYAFLASVIAVYFVVPKKLKNLTLLLFSLLFYYIGEQHLVLIMLLSVAVNYASGRIIARLSRAVIRRFVLIIAICFDIGLLFYFKYFDFFIENINVLFGSSMPLLKIALPIGISFYTFQTLSYVIDVYRKKVSAERNFINLATYVTFFPQLIAGPIVRFETISSELRERVHSFDNFAYGVRRFVFGLSKKVLLANAFAELIKDIGYSEEKTVVFCWVCAVSFAFQVYFDFSGYSDMAIGLGRMFGFHFDENFNYPYISTSITEFWHRWHISLGTWFRDYVYIPLGGNRVKKLRFVFNILTVWLLTGFWHGAEWTFILWGLMYGILLLIEKALPKQKPPRIIGWAYTMFFVLLGFEIFRADNIKIAFENIKAMFGFSSIPFSGVESLYTLKSFAVLFVVAMIAVTPIMPKLISKVNAKAVNVFEPLVCAVLLLLCTGYLIDGSFNPFLYFRF